MWAVPSAAGSAGSKSLVAEEASASHLLLTVDPVPVPGRGITFIGPTASVRFEEPEAVSFASTISVLCDGTRTPMEVMAGLLHLPAADVDRWMSKLVAAGHLVEVRAGAAPAVRWLAALGLSSEAIRRLEAARIAVVG